MAHVFFATVFMLLELVTSPGLSAATSFPCAEPATPDPFRAGIMLLVAAWSDFTNATRL